MIEMPQVQNLDDVYLIDSRHSNIKGIIGVFLVPSKEKDGTFMLIETGASSTLATLEQGISKAGFNPEKLSNVLVTHIHLDHAGAAGTAQFALWSKCLCP